MLRYLCGALAALAWGLCAPCPAHATNPSLLPFQSINGCLSGSMCPAGTWILGFDDEFSGSSVDTSKWTAIPSDGSSINGTTMECNSGDAVVSGGTLKVGNVGLPTLGSDTFVGCYVQGAASYGPGYFEARMRMNDTNGWGTFWTFAGPQTDCGGTISANGFEGDISENPLGGSTFSLHYDGYGSCETSYTRSLSGSVYDGNFHIYGMDLGDSGCATFYTDGVQNTNGQTCPGNIGSPQAQIILSNGSHSGGSTEMEVDWMRWYHH